VRFKLLLNNKTLAQWEDVVVEAGRVTAQREGGTQVPREFEQKASLPVPASLPKTEFPTVPKSSTTG